MSKQGRVLLIDDEPIMHRLMSRVLAAHEVVVKGDAGDALQLLGIGERFDVILCDLNMPKMNGMQFHHALSDIDEAAVDRMLFVTGGALNAASELFIGNMPGRVVQKPVSAASLRAAVALVLAGPAPTG